MPTPLPLPTLAPGGGSVGAEAAGGASSQGPELAAKDPGGRLPTSRGGEGGGGAVPAT